MLCSWRWGASAHALTPFGGQSPEAERACNNDTVWAQTPRNQDQEVPDHTLPRYVSSVLPVEINKRQDYCDIAPHPNILLRVADSILTLKPNAMKQLQPRAISFSLKLSGLKTEVLGMGNVTKLLEGAMPNNTRFCCNGANHLDFVWAQATSFKTC